MSKVKFWNQFRRQMDDKGEGQLLEQFGTRVKGHLLETARVIGPNFNLKVIHLVRISRIFGWSYSRTSEVAR